MVEMKIENFYVVEVRDEDFVRYPEVQEFCTFKYNGHPDGCPNYGKESFVPFLKDRFLQSPCPPHAPYIDSIAGPPWILVIAECNMLHYLDNMADLHKDMTEKQLRNVIWWQKRVRRKLREHTVDVMRRYPGTICIEKAEAHGVHLLVTMARAGFKIERIPTDKVYMINVLATPKHLVRRAVLPF